jgi:hypothetical protein
MSESTACGAGGAGLGALEPALLGRNFSSSSLGKKSPAPPRKKNKDKIDR